MTSRMLFVAAIVASSAEFTLGQVPAPVPVPVPVPVPYDTFCQQESGEKRRTFQAATPEHKALLFRTQVERFRDTNQARLTAAQLSLVKEMLALMIPATFTKGASTPEATAKLESLETQMATAFAKEDLRAMDQFGPCIAKKIAK